VLSFEDKPRRDPVSRAADQPEYRSADGVLRRILTDDRMRGIELALNTFGPNSGASPGLHLHAGYEYGVVLEGELTVEFEHGRYTLGPGDLISYESSQAHRIWNYGKTPARAVWVNLQRA
jgi:mannose-6-phosphate isomerase-like protein (cupin superfamily)